MKTNATETGTAPAFVSLVIPARDEESSIAALIDSIDAQSLPPDEIIVVDAGSIDATAEIIRRRAEGRSDLRLVALGPAFPGTARNAGVAVARGDWIAFVDCGTLLDADWLSLLAASIRKDVDIAFGNFHPVLSTWFDAVAALAYVPALDGGRSVAVRTPSIASCLVRKGLFDRLGGFPNFRAAEDLAFLDAVRKTGAPSVHVPAAVVHWRLAPGWRATFRRFSLYSYHNLVAGRGWDWHWGVARQYLGVTALLTLALVHRAFLLAPAIWLGARVGRTLWRKRNSFAIPSPLGPDKWFGVAGLLLVIDAATLVGLIRFQCERLKRRAPGIVEWKA